MNHVVAYFGPKEYLSKQKRYLPYKMEKPRKLTTRQHAGLVCDLNSRMAQIPPLFQESQQLDKPELVDSLANKAPRRQKAMLISQGFNPKTGYLKTFMEHCKQAETMEKITGANFAASDEDSDTKREKKRLKSKGQDKHVKKRQNQHSKLYCSLHGENTSHTTRECNLLKAKGKEKPKFSKKDYKRKYREVNLLENLGFSLPFALRTLHSLVV